MEPIQRIHHISATVGDPNENLQFYRDILQMRLIKQTVNFDDDNTYHLYFANEEVDAGSVMTFFPLTNDLYGRVGAGQVRRIAFSIPKGSFAEWQSQLTKHTVTFSEESLFNKKALIFNDPHNISLALIESEETREDIKILGFYGVELLSENPDETFKFLMQELGLELTQVSSEYYHLEMVGDEGQQVLVHRKMTKRGRLGIGTVHHIAWSVPNEEKLGEWINDIGKEYKTSDIINRKYFHSAYFRDPGHIIYELATVGPGFTVDETFAELGTSLMLPKHYENKRKEIESSLPKLELN